MSVVKMLVDLALNAFSSNGTVYSDSSGNLKTVSPGTSGQVLTSNGSGSAPSFQNATGSSLPSQTGNSGKFLTTDGTSASWGTPSGGGSSELRIPFATDCSNLYTFNCQSSGATFTIADASSTVTPGIVITSASGCMGTINWNPCYPATFGSKNAIYSFCTTYSFSGSDGLIWIGAGLPNNLLFMYGSLRTRQHVGFIIEKVSGVETWYASVADGSTQNRVSFTPPSDAATYQAFTIVLTAISAKFYVNDTLVATLTSNLPTDGYTYIFAGSSGSGASTVTLQVSSMSTSYKAA